MHAFFSSPTVSDTVHGIFLEWNHDFGAGCGRYFEANCLITLMSHTALKLIQLHRMNDLKQKIVVIWMGCPLCISITLFSVKCYPVTFFFPLIPGQGNVLRENKSMKLCLKIQINDSDTTPALTLKGTAIMNCLSCFCIIDGFGRVAYKMC